MTAGPDIAHTGRRSVTWVETLVALFIAALALLATVGFYEHAVNEARSRDTIALMRALHLATETYYQVNSMYPIHGGSTDDAIRAILGCGASAGHLEGISNHLLRRRERNTLCVDAWGTPVRCISPESRQKELQRRIRLAGNMPIFESAGADRNFGDGLPGDRSDNLSSDEL